MPAVRTGPLFGLFAQVVLLAALATTVGLGPAGWAVGLAFGIVTCAGLSHGLNRSGARGLGPADWVTLTRATLVGGVAALTAGSFHAAVPVKALVGMVVVALLLDGVDGQVARRTGTCSPLGARFDMEVDAFLLLVLSVYVTRYTGAWTLAIGGMRYAFVLAMWLLPWMRATLPYRYWRKVVAATQGVVLVAATANVLPVPVVVAALAGSLLLLVESFGRDVFWLWHRRPLRVGRRAPQYRPLTMASPPVPLAKVGKGRSREGVRV
ncbi:MAG TPA: CDP-alcohol phosphatidyltransferase family protein [Rugosimonospora sp.]|nr:CDP-alcohol phosphatidyltransferase family protein [Rugosimonospora sp.]